MQNNYQDEKSLDRPFHIVNMVQPYQTSLIILLLFKKISPIKIFDQPTSDAVNVDPLKSLKQCECSMWT